MTEEVKTEAEKGQEQMDAANLFREEIYTDRKIGVIRCLVPVTAEGKVDERAAGTAPRSCKQDCSSGSARLYASGRCRRQRLSYAVIWS